MSFLVEHPDYPILRDTSYDLAQPHDVVLIRGAETTLAAYLDSPQGMVTGFEPHFSWSARLAEDAWSPLEDGRLSTRNVPPGQHLLYLKYVDPEGRVHYSDLVMETFSAGSVKRLNMKLKPSLRLEGSLSANVERPISNGKFTHIPVNLCPCLRNLAPSCASNILFNCWTLDIARPGRAKRAYPV